MSARARCLAAGGTYNNRVLHAHAFAQRIDASLKVGDRPDALFCALIGSSRENDPIAQLEVGRHVLGVARVDAQLVRQQRSVNELKAAR